MRVPTSSCCCWLRRQGRLAARPRADDAGGAGTFEVQGLFYAVAARAAHAQSTGRGLFTGFVYEFLPRIGTSKKLGKMVRRGPAVGELTWAAFGMVVTSTV